MAGSRSRRSSPGVWNACNALAKTALECSADVCLFAGDDMDPDPTYTRFFTPMRGALPPDLDEIGRRYIGALADAIAKWLRGIDQFDAAFFRIAPRSI